MPSDQHQLETRATKLAAALNQRITAFSSAITPPGSRPPFTQPYSSKRALDAILNHWNHPATQQWISSMDPMSQLELRNALGEHIRNSGVIPQTAQPDGISLNGQAEMNRASSMPANPLAAGGFGMMRNVS